MNENQGDSSGVQLLPGRPGLTVTRNVACEARDGVTLRTDVYQPTEGGPYPVLLMRLPYDKTQAETIGYAHPAWYARQGYIVAVQDCRGRWQSDGEWYPFQYETTDGYDAIEWAARLPNSSNQVGMFGFSYAGATQLLPATARPPSLRSICPAFTGSQYYDGWTYNNGAFSLAFAASWATDLAQVRARRDRDDREYAELVAAFQSAPSWYPHLPLSDYPPLAGDAAPYFHDWLAHPTYDDYWSRWSIDEDYGRVSVPALHIAGWYDIFLNGSVRNFTGLQQSAGNETARRNQKLLIGPWMHLPWEPLGGAGDDEAGPHAIDNWQIRWFDQFLKDDETGVMDSPVTIFVLGERRWRDCSDWPPPEAVPTPFYLHSHGRANSVFGDGRLDRETPADEPPDVFSYDPAAPTLSQGGHSCCFPFVAPMGPANQGPSENVNGVLVYTTEPLGQDLTLMGEASVVLYAATSALDTDWTARLCYVDELGSSTNLQEGIVRARYRDSLVEPRLLTPWLVERYEITLGSVAMMIPAGYRIRVSISSSDFPQWDRNLNTGGPLFREGFTMAVVATQSVLHDDRYPSHIILPIVHDA